MLQRGELVTHFDVATVGGTRVRYADIWQRRNLVMVRLPVEASAERDEYVARLRDTIPKFAAHEAECVITVDTVSGVPGPAVVIADRWGEIVFVQPGRSIADLPDVTDILEWLRFVQYQCPECQGEAR